VCRNAVAAGLLIVFPPSVRAKDKLLVLVYNTAPLNAEVVSEAEEETSRIFHEAVIDLQWINCPIGPDVTPDTDPCRIHYGENPIYLHILPVAGAFPNEKALAHAAVAPEGGVRAVLFFDRIQVLMKKGDPPCNLIQMLGHIMAHEVGHLLLSQPGHTTKGIMIGPWNTKELRQAAEGNLLFTPVEAAKMREEVRLRVRRTLITKGR
jgi:hypothetical protein